MLKNDILEERSNDIQDRTEQKETLYKTEVQDDKQANGTICLNFKR